MHEAAIILATIGTLLLTGVGAAELEPGTPEYDSEAMTVLPGLDRLGLLYDVAFDDARGHAYFLTDTFIPRVVKVGFDVSGTPHVLGTLVVEEERSAISLAVDSGEGYLYLTVLRDGVTLLKFRLGENDEDLPVAVGSASSGFDGTNHDGGAILVDSAHGSAYALRPGSPTQILKFRLGDGDDDPVYLGSLTLNSGENRATCGVLDPAAGHGYIGAEGTSAARVVKISLGDGNALPERIAATSLIVGGIPFGDWEKDLMRAAIDVGNGHAYFSFRSSDMTGAGGIVKVALGAGDAAPARIGRITLSAPGVIANALVLDPAAGVGLAAGGAGDDSGTWFVQKFALGVGDTPPTPTSQTSVATTLGPPASGFLDPGSGMLYLGTDASPGEVLCVATGDGNDPPEVLDVLPLQGGDALMLRAAVDRENDRLYLTGTPGEAAGRLTAVEIGDGASAPRRIASVSGEPGERHFAAVAADPSRDRVYVAEGDGLPARLLVFDMASGEAAPTRAGALALGDEMVEVKALLVDDGAGYLYVPALTRSIAKVRLNSAPTLPELVSTYTATVTGEYGATAAALDAVGGYIYVATGTIGSNDAGTLAMFSVGESDSAPERIGSVSMQAGETTPITVAIDGPARRAYVGTRGVGWSHAYLVKYALSDDDSLPSRIGRVGLAFDPVNGSSLSPFSGLDGVGGLILTDENRVARVLVGDPDDPPTLGDSILLDDFRANFAHVAAAVDGSGSLYYADCFAPGRLYRVATSSIGTMQATRLTVSSAESIEALRYYSHRGVGNVRLALYNDDQVKVRLWMSPVFANPTQNGEVVVAVAGGTPGVLDLPAGTYWLAWQTDTAEPVMGLLPGEPGDGFIAMQHAFGEFPATLSPSDIVSTSRRWSLVLGRTSSVPMKAVAVR